MEEEPNNIFKEDKDNLKEISLEISKINEINKPINQDQDSLLDQRNTVKILTYNFFSRPPPVHTNG